MATNRAYNASLLGNSTSRAYKVEGNPADASLEPISMVVTGTFTGCTITLHVSNANTSPLVYAATATTWTAAGQKTVELVTGTQFRFALTSTGSPLSSVTTSARGQIAIAA